jgi:lysophospholipase L1-like esterase
MRWRRALGIVAAQVGALLCVALAAEVGVRCWREKGIRAGFASLVDGRGTQIDPGTRGAFARDDELGYRLQPALEGVNRLGFRGPELPAEKPPGRFRILIVGDSIAWDADGFVTGLESRFRTEFHGNVEVFNASVPGYTTFQERVFLGRLIAPVAPDVVLLEYCLNDNHRFLHRLTEDGGWLLTPEARATLLPEGDGVAARVARWSYLAFEIKKRLLALQRRSGSVHPWESEPDFGPAWKEETWPAERAEILAIQAETRAADARLLVLAVPYEPQLEPSLLARERDLALAPQAHLASVCRDAAIPFLDLAPAFESARTAHPSEPLFRDRVHLTAAGHAVAAAALRDRLCAERLLPADCAR